MQSKTMSLIESIVDILIGLVIAIIVQLLVFPLYGITTTLFENFQIAVIFTVVGVIRKYVVRRWLNKLLIDR